MAGAHLRSRAGPGQEERRANYTRTAGFSMIVLDASVVVELVTTRPLADSLRRDLVKRDEAFIVPHLLEIEVVSVAGLLPASAWILIEASCAFAHRRSGFVGPLGNCGRIRPLKTPRTSLWQRQPIQSITPATRICRRAIGRGSRCLLIESNPSVSIGERLLPSQICPGMPRLFRFGPE
jgi:hypothetical protein